MSTEGSVEDRAAKLRLGLSDLGIERLWDALGLLKKRGPLYATLASITTFCVSLSLPASE